MRILVACEESQAVTKELRKLRHDAYSNDIVECSGGHPEWHIQKGTLEILNDGWDMIIAFPPCTYLSNAGACRLYPTKGNIDEERYKKGLKGKEFFMAILNADCPKIAVENPVSSLAFEMPKCTQEIQPYHFGHPFSKKTRLWLKGLPELKYTNVVEKEGTFLPSSTSKNAYTGLNDKKTRDPKEASKTFLGIAKAMANQWGGYEEIAKDMYYKYKELCPVKYSFMWGQCSNEYKEAWIAEARIFCLLT
tara:strand:- start:667 stop:1413 length:747 start_codon:yes stop_codon:yes gene_type:complete